MKDHKSALSLALTQNDTGNQEKQETPEQKINRTNQINQCNSDIQNILKKVYALLLQYENSNQQEKDLKTWHTANQIKVYCKIIAILINKRTDHSVGADEFIEYLLGCEKNQNTNNFDNAFPSPQQLLLIYKIIKEMQERIPEQISGEISYALISIEAATTFVIKSYAHRLCDKCVGNIKKKLTQSPQSDLSKYTASNIDSYQRQLQESLDAILINLEKLWQQQKVIKATYNSCLAFKKRLLTLLEDANKPDSFPPNTSDDTRLLALHNKVNLLKKLEEDINDSFIPTTDSNFQPNIASLIQNCIFEIQPAIGKTAAEWLGFYLAGRLPQPTRETQKNPISAEQLLKALVIIENKISLTTNVHKRDYLAFIKEKILALLPAKLEEQRKQLCEKINHDLYEICAALKECDIKNDNFPTATIEKLNLHLTNLHNNDGGDSIALLSHWLSRSMLTPNELLNILSIMQKLQVAPQPSISHRLILNNLQQAIQKKFFKPPTTISKQNENEDKDENEIVTRRIINTTIQQKLLPYRKLQETFINMVDLHPNDNYFRAGYYFTRELEEITITRITRDLCAHEELDVNQLQPDTTNNTIYKFNINTKSAIKKLDMLLQLEKELKKHGFLNTDAPSSVPLFLCELRAINLPYTEPAEQQISDIITLANKINAGIEAKYQSMIAAYIQKLYTEKQLVSFYAKRNIHKCPGCDIETIAKILEPKKFLEFLDDLAENKKATKALRKNSSQVSQMRALIKPSDPFNKNVYQVVTELKKDIDTMLGTTTNTEPSETTIREIHTFKAQLRELQLTAGQVKTERENEFNVACKKLLPQPLFSFASLYRLLQLFKNIFQRNPAPPTITVITAKMDTLINTINNVQSTNPTAWKNLTKHERDGYQQWVNETKHNIKRRENKEAQEKELTPSDINPPPQSSPLRMQHQHHAAHCSPQRQAISFDANKNNIKTTMFAQEKKPFNSCLSQSFFSKPKMQPRTIQPTMQSSNPKNQGQEQKQKQKIITTPLQSTGMVI